MQLLLLRNGKKKCSESNGKSDEFDLFPDITHLMLDIICETAMGCTMNTRSDANSYYVKAIYDASEVVINRIFFPLYWSDTLYAFTAEGKKSKHAFDILHQFTESVIVERRKQMADKTPHTQKKRMAFIDILLTAKDQVTGTTLSDSDIREEVDTFMFEGHDTTSAAIAWTLFKIGQNPDIQDKLHAEIDAILVNKDIPSYDDLSGLKYLSNTLKEGLRLFPSVPYYARSLDQDTDFNGFIAPKGTQVAVFPYLIHHDPKLWEDPERFDPDRWINETGRHPFAYIPFSAGSRNCIGQTFALLEEKVIMAAILKKFQIKTTKNNVSPNPELILRPMEGVYVELNLRTQKIL